MGFFDKLGGVAKWITRQKHHPGVAELEAAVPILGVIEKVAEDVVKLQSSFGHKHLQGLAIETLAKRTGQEPQGSDIAKLFAELRKRGIG